MQMDPLSWSSDWSCLDCGHTVAGNEITAQVDSIEEELGAEDLTDTDKLEGI